jgi:hypothetical protein
MPEQICNVSQPSDVPKAENFTPTSNGPELTLLAEDALRRIGSRWGLCGVGARVLDIFDGIANELCYRASQGSCVAKEEEVRVTL